MRKNNQQTAHDVTAFDRKSRENYFDMLKQAHVNLSMVDHVDQSPTIKMLIRNQEIANLIDD